MFNPTTVRDILLNERIEKCETKEALQEFYDDNVVMQENNQEPTVGKDANRKREREFASRIKELHGFELVHSAVHGDVTLSQWNMDITFADGKRLGQEQVAVRQWKNGKVITSASSKASRAIKSLVSAKGDSLKTDIYRKASHQRVLRATVAKRASLERALENLVVIPH